MSSTFYLIGIGFFVGVAAWFLFIWAVKSGQFDDPEAPKYRMLDDEDEHGKPSIHETTPKKKKSP
jgi:cbb3-type cytochrome oxidase maturation protein